MTEIQKAEKIILDALAKVQKDDQRFMLQPWEDGWLIHVYKDNGKTHLTTVGSHDLESTIKKLTP